MMQLRKWSLRAKPLWGFQGDLGLCPGFRNCWRIGGTLEFCFLKCRFRSLASAYYRDSERPIDRRQINFSATGWWQRVQETVSSVTETYWLAWTKKSHCSCFDPSVPFIARLGNRKLWSCMKSKLLLRLFQTTTNFDHVWDMRFPCYKSTNSNHPRYILTNDLDIEHAKYKLNDIVVCWKTF